jgi:hypothetical protein
MTGYANADCMGWPGSRLMVRKIGYNRFDQPLCHFPLGHRFALLIEA